MSLVSLENCQIFFWLALPLFNIYIFYNKRSSVNFVSYLVMDINID